MLDWLRLLRASGFATIVSNSLAAVALAFYAGEGDHLKWLAARLWYQRDQVGWVLVTSFLLYAAGMVWNDIVDAERDRRHRSERPLASGRIGLVPAMTVGVLLVAAPVLTALLVKPIEYGVPLAGVILCLGLLYNLATKEIPVLGAITMGLTRGVHALFALLILGEDHVRMALDPMGGPPALRGLLLYPLLIALYTTGVTLIAWVEDRERNGTRLTALAGAGLIGIAVLLAASTVVRAPWISIWLHAGTAWASLAVVILLGGLAVTAWAIYRLAKPWLQSIQSCRCADVGPVIGVALGGMVLVDALVATAGHPVLGLVVLALFPLFTACSRLIRMD